jgi:inhibitor of KinA
MTKYQLTYKPYGNSAILIEWPARIDAEMIQDIASFEKVVAKQQKVVDTVIAYNSLLIQLQHRYNYSNHHKHRKDFSKTVAELKELYAMERTRQVSGEKVWQIPVCYEEQFGLDLQELSKAKNLSVKEIIQMHSQPKYLIYFLGFQPGFLYLGGLDKQLHTPRKANPRLRVAKGSVAIGVEQTGVYPQDSSGGWNIVGKSPIDFFDISQSNPCFAKAGDFIQFVSVDLETYERISEEVKAGRYQLKFQES